MASCGEVSVAATDSPDTLTVGGSQDATGSRTLIQINAAAHCQKAMGAASVSEVTSSRQLPDALPVCDIIITAPPSAVIGD
jgi:hypothetical protein